MWGMFGGTFGRSTYPDQEDGPVWTGPPVLVGGASLRASAVPMGEPRGSGGTLDQHFEPNLAVGTQAGAEVYSCCNRRMSTQSRSRQQSPPAHRSR
jgi:hypothetical protein